MSEEQENQAPSEGGGVPSATGGAGEANDAPRAGSPWAAIAFALGLISMCAFSVWVGVAAVVVACAAGVLARRLQLGFLGKFLVIAGCLLGLWGAILALAPGGLHSPGAGMKKARAVSDLHSISTALEVYFEDHGSYPASSSIIKENQFSPWPGLPYFYGQTTFQRSQNGAFVPTLTTPIAYVLQFDADPYAPERGATYCYFCKGARWVAWSAGPDRKYQLTNAIIAKLVDESPTTGALRAKLIPFQYDPTNGAASAGELIQAR